MSRASTELQGGLPFLGASALLAGAAWFALLCWRPVAPPPDAEFVTFSAEVDRLRGHTDAELDSWRKRRDGLQAKAWTAESLDGLVAQAGDRWSWAWPAPDRAILQCTEPRMEGWPQYLDSLEMLARQPGIIIEEIEVRAAGDGDGRRFTGIRFGLRFIVGGATVDDGARAAPNRGPPPVVAADGPAMARKVGPGRPLHRPAASAEPPADGPPSASFRPDPPGPGAGAYPTNINPTDKS